MQSLNVILAAGKVLTGLNHRIDKTLAVSCIQDPDSLNKTLQTNIDGQSIFW